MASIRAKVIYAEEDQSYVEVLRRALLPFDIDIQGDESSPLGANLLDTALKRIEESDKIILLLSPAALDSANFDYQRFYTYLKKSFNNNQGVILPVVIKECIVPAWMEKVVYADFTKDSQNATRMLKEALQNTAFDNNLSATPHTLSVRNYLLSLLNKGNQANSWRQKYVPLSTELQSKPNNSRTTPMGFVPISFNILESYFNNDGSSEADNISSIETAMKMFSKILLLGAPGSGKTTTLYKLLLELAEQALDDHNKKIPVLIRLGKEWPKNASDFGSFLSQRLKTEGLDTLHASQITLLLDGLNEIAEEKRFDRIASINEWMEQQRDLKVVLTCRPD